jgi:CheY-like chemotaxis protein
MSGAKSPLILIVEDSEEDYEAALRAFKAAQLNNPFFWCKSGRMAMDYLRREGAFKGIDTASPGLILLDLNMPGIDGHKTLQFIKGDPQFKDIPVIILTTSGHERDITACYREGANSYIQKPITFEGLSGAIKGMKEASFEISLG